MIDIYKYWEKDFIWKLTDAEFNLQMQQNSD